MDIEDYKKENAELHQRVADLVKANNELIIHNIQLGKKVDAYYDVRRRIHIYKELLLRHTEFLRQMYYLMSRRDWNVAACAQQAGFSAIRSFNRKFQDALGMTPHEFRILIDSHPTPKDQ